jgi:hypothetical protein
MARVPSRWPEVEILSRKIGDVMPKCPSAAAFSKTAGNVPSAVGVAHGTGIGGVVAPAGAGGEISGTVTELPAGGFGHPDGKTVTLGTRRDGVPSYTLRVTTREPGANENGAGALAGAGSLLFWALVPPANVVASANATIAFFTSNTSSDLHIARYMRDEVLMKREPAT